MRVLGLDPGETTGWSLFDEEIRIDGGVIINGRDGFIEWAKTEMPQHDVLVVEDFVVQPDFVGTPVASEVIGAAFALSDAPRKVKQLRAQKATVVAGTEAQRNAWLRSLGFDFIIHEMDATVHVLVFLKRIGHKAAFWRYWGTKKPRP
ncbi:RuvC-like resolvase [Microbacterium phage Pavlo]|nr:RuvC-like resolvase [Microbacterium phage Pavlo]